MANEFGEAYRQEVRDVNKGAVQKEQQGLESKLSTRGTQVEYTDPTFTREGSNKDKVIAGLLEVGGTLADGAMKEEQKTDFNEARTRGINAGLSEIQKQEPTWLNKIGFKNAGYKGFQQGIIDTAVNKQFMSKINSMETDVKTMDTEAYGKKAREEMLGIIEDYNDPETKNRIIESLTNNIESLSQSHVKRRVQYERELRKRQVIDTISQSAETLKAASDSGDTQLILQANINQLAVLKPVPGMDNDEWSDITTEAVIGQLRNGDESVVETLRRTGQFDKLVGEDKDAINAAHNAFKQNNNRLLATKEIELSRAVATQAENRYDLANQINKMNPTALNMNAFFKADARRAQEISDEATRMGILTNSLYTGGWEAQAANQKDRNTAWSNIVTDIGTQLVISDKKEQMRTAQNSGDKLPFDPDSITNGSYTPSATEIQDAILRNPQSIIAVWKKNQLPLPLVSAGISNTTALLNSKNLSDKDVQQLALQLNTLNQFQKADPTAFAKEARSESELMDFTLWNQFVNKDGMPVRNAMEQIRQIKDRPEVTDLSETQIQWLDEDSESISDEVIDQLGEEFLGIFNTDPSNKITMDNAIEKAYEEAIILTRGNRAEARAVARNLMMRRSAIIGNKFIPEGERLRKAANGFDIEAYMRGREATSEFNDHKKQFGFPGDIDLLEDDRVWVTDAGGNMPLQFNMLQDGQVITLQVPLPKTEKHMLQYGVSGTLLNTMDIITAAPIAIGNKGSELIRKKLNK